MFGVNDFSGAQSAAQSFKNGSILTSPREGLKTLIYGTAAGIDPHRINRSKLPPWYIAGPCYCSPPPSVNFPFPSRSALHAVGQSSRTALPLLPAYLTSSSPARHAAAPSAPLLQSHYRYFNDYHHLPAAPRGVRGGRGHVDSTKWLQIKEIQGLDKLLKLRGTRL